MGIESESPTDWVSAPRLLCVLYDLGGKQILWTKPGDEIRKKVSVC